MANNEEEAQHDEMREDVDGCMYIYENSYGPEKSLYRKLYAVGFLLGFTIVMAIFLFLLLLFVLIGYLHLKSPSIPFQLRSLDLDLDLASNSSVAFSVHNPLPDSVYFHVAEASVRYGDRVVGFKLMDPFRVMMGEHVVVSLDLSPGGSLGFGYSTVDRVVGGFEFTVEGLVKIHDGSVTEKFGLVRVVCGGLQVRFSSSSVGALAGGPRHCRSSWEYF